MFVSLNGYILHPYCHLLAVNSLSQQERISFSVNFTSPWAGRLSARLPLNAYYLFMTLTNKTKQTQPSNITPTY